jgi:hypothetical protein
VARERGEPWLARYGGLISSEWEFAKGLQILEEDPEVYERMDRFVEAADWIVWQLCGRETRNTCTAGYKGIFQDGGYPPRTTCARSTSASRTSSRRRSAARWTRWARGRATSPRRPRDGPGCRRGSPSRSATWTHMSPRPPRGRSKQARCSPSWELRRATS